MSASPGLLPLLAANPPPRSVGRVPVGRQCHGVDREIGQGVLTAMLQIAADELDIAPDRI